MDIESMTPEQLRAQQAEWYRCAEVTGLLVKIAMIARELGKDPVSIKFPGYCSTYGPKYLWRIGTGETAISVYVDDYGHYMTVHVGDRRVCSTHDTERLFVPGEWSSILVTHFQQAEDAKAARIAKQVEAEKRRLLAQLTPGD